MQHCRSDLAAVEVAAKEAAKHNEIMEIWVDVAAFPLPWGEETSERPRGSDSQQVNCQQKVPGSKILAI